jgi:hypothetical protein
VFILGGFFIFLVFFFCGLNTNSLICSAAVGFTIQSTTDVVIDI